MASLKWTELEKPLSTSILDVIRKFKFSKMTPVQAATIPQIMSHRDVSVEAVTGSGKTLAFIIPMLEILLRRQMQIPWTNKEIGAIVISPTRELATQTSDVLSKFLEHKHFKGFKQKLLVGGSNTDEDIAFLKTNASTVLICTPGRLEELLERKGDLNLAGRLKSLEFLVLDEADRLLDLGFKNTINTILSYLPRQRRTGLFSATQTKEVTDLMRAGLRNPVLVSVKEKSSLSTPVLLKNHYTIVEPDEKFAILLSFLKDHCQEGKTLIFFSTCACVEYWSRILPNFLKMKILALHGKMQNKRNKILEKFRNGENAILLSTDVLARGLDVAEINWVIQFDPPSNAAAFVHRVGRTARQGTEGNALVMLLAPEDAYVNFLKLNQKVVLNPYHVELNESSVKEINKIIYKLQIDDRDIYDKAIRAFVSYIRAYTKHECNAILRLKDLNFGKIATSYGLIHLPKMPEINNSNSVDFIGPDFEINLENISYRNQQKEKIRKEKLDTYSKTGAWPGAKKGKKKVESWDLSKQARSAAREKRQERKAKKKLKKATVAEPKKAKKRKLAYTDEDLRELAKDIQLIKKFKRKKISEEDFNKKIGFDDI